MIPRRFIDYYGDDVRWFVGTVKDIDDPKQLGRIKVRIFGIHSDSKELIPDDDLPWAQVMSPITEGGTAGLGVNVGIKEDALVFGVFLDGQNSQLPLVLGSLPKEEEYSPGGLSTNQLARGTNTITKTPDGTIGEPPSPYDPIYPYNSVKATWSGHVIELDDTPEAERIHIYHKSGSFIEMHPNGDVVTRTRNGWKSVVGNEKIHVTSNMDIIVDGNLNITAGSGQINLASGDVVASDVSLKNHKHIGNLGVLTSAPTNQQGQLQLEEEGAAAVSTVADPLLTSIIFEE